MATEIRIALAADTILYLPAYLLERDSRFSGGEGFRISLVPEDGPKGGDQVAFDMVRSGAADLCLCDPMVAISESRDPSAVVVASIVSKVGLWGITTPYIDFDFQSWEDDLIDYALKVPEKPIRTILTYKEASSGRKAIEFLKRTTREELDKTLVFYEDFGKELTYLTQPYNEKPVDLIVTCDLVGVLAALAQGDYITEQARKFDNGDLRAKFPPLMGIKFHERPGFQECLFTALIASKRLVSEKPGIVFSIVQEFQAKLEQFYRYTESDFKALSRFLCRQKNLFPTVGSHDGAVIRCHDRLREEYCHDAIRYLRDHKILAGGVRLEASAWESACTIWAIPKSDRAIEDPFHFQRCTVTKFADDAHPGELKKNLRDAYRRHKALIFALGSSYGLLSATFGLVGKTVGGLNSVLWFSASVLLFGVLLWGGSRWLFGSSLDSD